MQRSRQKQAGQLQHKKKALHQKFTIATATLLESCPSARLNRHLREVLLDYISSHKDALPLDFEVYLYDFTCLFDFLDALEDEQTSKTKKPLI
jgi:hypothetical protein